MTVREQLRQLHKLGWDVRVIGATIFDSPKGITRLANHWEKIEQSKSKVVRIKDTPLVHNLVKTRSTQRAEMTAAEEAIWYQTYTKALDQFKPDIVYYYGGRTLDLLIGDEAHARGIPVAAYLANGNFRGTRWCRDVDVVITNSKATADLYRRQDGIDSVTLGPFVQTADVIASTRQPRNVLAINPSLAKGAAIVAAVASRLEKRRPDIPFEVVESRGNWATIVSSIRKQLGQPNEPLTNVTVTPNVPDMRAVYGRARLLLIFSLWWESLPRVAIEGTVNHVPILATNRSGLPEALGESGILFDLPDSCFRSPYNKLPSGEKIAAIAGTIELLQDNPEAYREMEKKSAAQGQMYSLETMSRNLETAMLSIVAGKPQKN